VMRHDILVATQRGQVSRHWACQRWSMENSNRTIVAFEPGKQQGDHPFLAFQGSSFRLVTNSSWCGTWLAVAMIDRTGDRQVGDGRCLSIPEAAQWTRISNPPLKVRKSLYGRASSR